MVRRPSKTQASREAGAQSPGSRPRPPAAEESGGSAHAPRHFRQKLSPSAVLFLRPEDIHVTPWSVSRSRAQNCCFQPSRIVFNHEEHILRKTSCIAHWLTPLLLLSAAAAADAQDPHRAYSVLLGGNSFDEGRAIAV